MSTTQERIDQITNLDSTSNLGVMDRALCLSLTLHKPGTRKKVKSTAKVKKSEVNLLNEPVDGTTEIAVINDELDTDRKALHLSKDFMDCAEIKNIRAKDREIVAYLDGVALPTIFKRGIRLIALQVVPEVDHVLVNMRNSREALVEILIERLPAIIEEHRERLKDMFNLKDYPTPEALRAEFSMEWNYLGYGANEKLKEISHELYQREVTKVESAVNDAANQIKTAYLESFAAMIDHAKDKLTPKANGKPKKIDDEMIPHIQEFLATFASRSAGLGGPEMEALVASARVVLQGVTPELVSTSQDVRERLNSGFAGIQEVLDGMVINRKARKLRLDDDSSGDDAEITESASDDAPVETLELTEMPAGSIDANEPETIMDLFNEGASV